MPPLPQGRNQGVLHPDHSIRSARSTRDYGRRSSRNQQTGRSDGGTTLNPESARDRHWNIVLGSDRNVDQPASRSTSSSPETLVHGRPPTELRREDQRRPPRPRPSNPTGDPSTSRTFDTSHRQSRTAPPRPFACDQCPRRFERRGHLESHIDAIHRLRQPYECDVAGCGKTFSHRSSLSRHIKGVHEKNRYRSQPSRNPRSGGSGDGSSHGIHGYGQPRA